MNNNKRHNNRKRKSRALHELWKKHAAIYLGISTAFYISRKLLKLLLKTITAFILVPPDISLPGIELSATNLLETSVPEIEQSSDHEKNNLVTKLLQIAIGSCCLIFIFLWIITPKEPGMIVVQLVSIFSIAIAFSIEQLDLLSTIGQKETRLINITLFLIIAISTFAINIITNESEKSSQEQHDNTEIAVNDIYAIVNDPTYSDNEKIDLILTLLRKLKALISDRQPSVVPSLNEPISESIAPEPPTLHPPTPELVAPALPTSEPPTPEPPISEPSTPESVAPAPPTSEPPALEPSTPESVTPAPPTSEPPTPEPPKSSATPTPTATSVPTPRLTPTNVNTPIPKPTETPTITTSPTPRITETPTPTETLTITPSPTPRITETPTPTETPTLMPSSTNTPSPTPRVSVTPTPPMTPTPKPELVTLCHFPPGNPGNGQTIQVPIADVQEHLNHGDYLGACRDN